VGKMGRSTRSKNVSRGRPAEEGGVAPLVCWLNYTKPGSVISRTGGQAQGKKKVDTHPVHKIKKTKMPSKKTETKTEKKKRSGRIETKTKKSLMGRCRPKAGSHGKKSTGGKNEKKNRTRTPTSPK